MAESRYTRQELEAFAELPMVEWEAEYAKLGQAKRREVDDHLSAMAERYTRAARYIARREQGGKHADAVKAQNTAAGKVRRALGYTYPSVITF